MRTVTLETGAAVTFYREDDGVMFRVIDKEKRVVHIFHIPRAEFSYLIAPERAKDLAA